MQIKHSTWFAAGQEVQRATLLLSDGAFRLYLYICLNAARDTGSFSMSYHDLARVLNRSRRSVSAYFEELRKSGVCQLNVALNQHQQTEVTICDEFWPYTRTNGTVPPSDSEQYLSQIQSLLSRRACVRCTWTVADKKFAQQLAAKAVSLQQIEHGIALGCSRKYVSLLNGSDSGEIKRLSYFQDVIEEAGDDSVPVGYWDYVMPGRGNMPLVQIVHQHGRRKNR
jgi:hypothetical protein